MMALFEARRGHKAPKSHGGLRGNGKRHVALLSSAFSTGEEPEPPLHQEKRGRQRSCDREPARLDLKPKIQGEHNAAANKRDPEKECDESMKPERPPPEQNGERHG